MIGFIDEHGVGPRNIETALNDGGSQEDVGIASHKGEHHIFEFMLVEPSVSNHHLGIGHDAGKFFFHAMDVFDAVVHEIHLTAAGQFPLDGVSNQPVIPTSHTRFHRLPIGGRSGQTGDIANPEHRHVQRAWDGSGGHRQHVNTRSHRL